MMMTTLMATIMIVMMCRGPASPADSPAVPTPRGLDPIALDRWVGNHTVLVFLHLQVSRVDSKLSFSSGGRKAFALDSQGLPMRTNMMTYGDLMRSSLVTPCQKCVSFLKIRNNFLASKSHLFHTLVPSPQEQQHPAEVVIKEEQPEDLSIVSGW